MSILIRPLSTKKTLSQPSQASQKVLKPYQVGRLEWTVEKEYESNPIAADSDDEKKMYRAHIRAEKKAREERFSRRT